MTTGCNTPLCDIPLPLARNVTQRTYAAGVAQTYTQCENCEERLDGSDEVKPGRTRQFCSPRCRQAGARARQRDPAAWQRKQATLKRRQQARARTVEESQTDLGRLRQEVRDAKARAMRAEKKLDEERRAAFDPLSLIQPVNRPDELIADPQVHKLLTRALVTDSTHEASTCLDKARELHMKRK